jgi:ribosomal protein S21
LSPLIPVGIGQMVVDEGHVVAQATRRMKKSPSQDRLASEHRRRGDHGVPTFQRKPRKVGRTRPTSP